MMRQPPSRAVIDAWTALVQAQQLVLGAVEDDLKRAGFPPLAWYDILLELHRAGPTGLRPSAIEERLLLAQHNVSRLLTRLAKAGLVERRPCDEDGRGQVVTISTAGDDLRRRMWPVYAAAIERHVGAKLGDEAAAETLAKLLRRLVDTPG